jgi:hypothetical protein
MLYFLFNVTVICFALWLVGKGLERLGDRMIEWGKRRRDIGKSD